MELWLCHKERDQYYYFDVLPTAMNDSVYRNITGKLVVSDSSDMMAKGKIDWFASWLICIHEAANYIMWTYIGNACVVEREEVCFSRDRKCLQYHEPRIYIYYFILKGMSLNWIEISLVYELSNCRCMETLDSYQ
jgi:hypothetical protein